MIGVYSFQMVFKFLCAVRGRWGGTGRHWRHVCCILIWPVNRVSNRVCLFHSDVFWTYCCCFLSFLSVLGFATCTPILGVVPFGSSWRVPLDLHEDMVNGCWEGSKDQCFDVHPS